MTALGGGVDEGVNVRNFILGVVFGLGLAVSLFLSWAIWEIAGEDIRP